MKRNMVAGLLRFSATGFCVSEIGAHSLHSTVASESARLACLRLQIAVSDYRQGKWTPKRFSKDYKQSDSYEVAIG